MTGWLGRIAALVAQHAVAARAVIIAADGPTPRDVGSALIVAGGRAEGRIGRGELERTVIAEAAGLCTGHVPGAGSNLPRWQREVRRFPTGPVLGEATGGVITVLIEVFRPAEIAALQAATRSAACQDPVVARAMSAGAAAMLLADADAATEALEEVTAAAGRLFVDRGLRVLPVAAADGTQWLLERSVPAAIPFHVYGSGLLGRALIGALAGLPFAVCWVDKVPEHFPELAGSGNARRIAVDDPARYAADAGPGAFHAVMTQSHELDYVVCRAVLRRNEFSYLGAIGSRVKRQRLEARLHADGISPVAMARFVCPMGLPGIRSKVPEVIAVSIAAQALLVLQAPRDSNQASGMKR